MNSRVIIRHIFSLKTLSHILDVAENLLTLQKNELIEMECEHKEEENSLNVRENSSSKMYLISIKIQDSLFDFLLSVYISLNFALFTFLIADYNIVGVLEKSLSNVYQQHCCIRYVRSISCEEIHNAKAWMCWIFFMIDTRLMCTQRTRIIFRNYHQILLNSWDIQWLKFKF